MLSLDLGKNFEDTLKEVCRISATAYSTSHLPRAMSPPMFVCSATAAWPTPLDATTTILVASIMSRSTRFRSHRRLRHHHPYSLSVPTQARILNSSLQSTPHPSLVPSRWAQSWSRFLLFLIRTMFFRMTGGRDWTLFPATLRASLERPTRFVRLPRCKIPT